MKFSDKVIETKLTRVLKTMAKKITLGLISMASLLVSSYIWAAPCGRAVPTNDPGFCRSFKEVAICYCTSSGLPSFICQDMELLYQRMESLYGSLDRACAAQNHTSKEDCLDNWNCYRLGQVDSHGRLCSSNGHRCV